MKRAAAVAAPGRWQACADAAACTTSDPPVLHCACHLPELHTCIPGPMKRAGHAVRSSGGEGSKAAEGVERMCVMHSQERGDRQTLNLRPEGEEEVWCPI